jgi:hypothetical protein
VSSTTGNKIAEEEAQLKAEEDDLKRKLEALQMKRMELKSKRKPLAALIKKLTRTSLEHIEKRSQLRRREASNPKLELGLNELALVWQGLSSDASNESLLPYSMIIISCESSLSSRSTDLRAVPT